MLSLINHQCDSLLSSHPPSASVWMLSSPFAHAATWEATGPARSCALWTRSPSPSTSRRLQRQSSSRRRWRRWPTRLCYSPWRCRSVEGLLLSTYHRPLQTGYGKFMPEVLVFKDTALGPLCWIKFARIMPDLDILNTDQHRQHGGLVVCVCLSRLLSLLCLKEADCPINVSFLGAQVRFPQSTSPGAQSAAKARREGGHACPRDGLD